VYVPHAFLTMIIVLEPCYEVMNNCVLSCQLYIHSALSTFTYCICHYPHHDLMVQVISRRWCALVLVTLPLASHLLPVRRLGPLDLVGLPPRLHHHHHLHRP
jgi:hypothetical protein